MGKTEALAVVAINMALLCYTVGVWGEHLARRLQGWHLLFFWTGFSLDTLGTTLMGRLAGSFQLNIHAVTGVVAIVLMLVHALWATIVLLRRDEHAIRNFHKFSTAVWGIWLIPFLTGMFLAMTGGM